MKIVIVDSSDQLSALQTDSITFIRHDVDPDHSLQLNKFLYYHTEDELREKINLLSQDITVQDLLRS